MKVMVKKFGRFKNMDEFFEAIESMKVGEEVVFEGIENPEIEVVNDLIHVKSYYRTVNGRRIKVKAYYRRKK